MGITSTPNLAATVLRQPRINLIAISFPYSTLTGMPPYFLLHAPWNNPFKTCRSVAAVDNIPPCMVALIPQSKNAAGDPKGSMSTIEPLSPFFE